MASAVEARPRASDPEPRFVLYGVGWDCYEAILKAVGDRHDPRLTYDRGDLELMSPSQEHERSKALLGRLIETLTLELDLPCDALGSTTWRKQLEARGLEPDECYYLANAGRVIGRAIDLNVDPPPDLAIEVEISRSALDRMGIYAAPGVPEVWRYDGEVLRVEVLQPDGAYRQVTVSPSLPIHPLDEVARWLRLGETMGQTPWLRQFREWVRDTLGPR